MMQGVFVYTQELNLIERLALLYVFASLRSLGEVCVAIHLKSVYLIQLLKLKFLIKTFLSVFNLLNGLPRRPASLKLRRDFSQRRAVG